MKKESAETKTGPSFAVIRPDAGFRVHLGLLLSLQVAKGGGSNGTVVHVVVEGHGGIALVFEAVGLLLVDTDLFSSEYWLGNLNFRR